MSDNPLDLLKEELENDDVKKYIYSYSYLFPITYIYNYLNIDSNKSKCNT